MVLESSLMLIFLNSVHDFDNPWYFLPEPSTVAIIGGITEPETFDGCVHVTTILFITEVKSIRQNGVVSLNQHQNMRGKF